MSASGNDSTSNMILDAVEIIVDKKIANAGFDRTVQATVVDVVDRSIGSYKVKYQDSVFIAEATSADLTFSKGTEVYVLIPKNNLSDKRVILGGVERLGPNYTSFIEDIDKYEILYSNCANYMIEKKPFELCSYQDQKIWIQEYGMDSSYSSLISFYDFKNFLSRYPKEADSFIVKFKVKTSLPVYHKTQGNYGIAFVLGFGEGDTVNSERTYILDIDNMIGNPYNYINYTEQYAIFDITDDCIGILGAYIFNKDFPKVGEVVNVSDIFIDDIQLYPSRRYTNEELEGGVLSLYSANYYVSQDYPCTLYATVKLKGNKIDNISQNVKFYWFLENGSIDSYSDKYNQYGKQGWMCLNNYNVINEVGDNLERKKVVEWIPGEDNFTITTETFLNKKAKIKCVAVADDFVFEKIVEILNYDSHIEMTILELNSKGEVIYNEDNELISYFGEDIKNLKCNVESYLHFGFKYKWSLRDADQSYISLPENEDLNFRIQSYENGILELEEKVSTGEKLQEEVKYSIEGYKYELNSLLKEYSPISKEENLLNIQVKNINKYNIYTCSVYDENDIFLGSVSKTIVNKYEDAANRYNLVINGGDRVFKYDADGLSPLFQTSKEKENNEISNTLTVSLYNENGEEIPQNNYSVDYEIEENSLIQVVTVASVPNFSLIYDISNIFDFNKNNNNITFTIKYKNMIFTKSTNFIFLKDGENGTNGTDYFCRIVPYKNNSYIYTGDNLQYCTILNDKIYYGAAAKNINTNWAMGGRLIPFKIQLWQGNSLVLNDNASNSSEGYTIRWSILKNKYTSSVEDTSSFVLLNSLTGEFRYNGELDNHPCNIIKVEVTYRNVTCYAFMPIITVYLKNNWKLSNRTPIVMLKDKTGFLSAMYTPDGKHPQYRDSIFEILVNIPGVGEISNYDYTGGSSIPSYNLTYNWSILGKTYGDSWVDSRNLISKNTTSLQKNQYDIRLSQNYDGLCVNNALLCVISNGGEVKAKIHIPIYLYLNRYGNSAINGWDGNSIEINNDGGVILSPQVGAGTKNYDNSFTGVVMGKVKESGATSTDIGLVGYSSGQRSIFLDAKTGSASFGVNNKGRLIIDPKNNKAEIYSGNYSTSNKTGMKIDFTTPEIRFGSGNFIVDSSGHLTAKGGGTIANWSISDNYLSSNNITLHSGGYLYSNNKSTWASNSNGFFLSSSGLKIGSNFSVDSSGILTATEANVSGAITATSGEIGGWTLTSSRFQNSDGSVYIGPNGWRFGDNFAIDSSGNVYISGNISSNTVNANSGSIGGWSIDPSSISSGGISLNSGGNITGSGGWTINSSGFSSPTITNGNFSGSLGGFNVSSSNGIVFGSPSDEHSPSTVIMPNKILLRGGGTTEYGSQQFLVSKDTILLNANNIIFSDGGGRYITVEDIIDHIGASGTETNIWSRIIRLFT